MEYNLVIKKNEIMPFSAKWMDLEITILSKVSQKEKNKYYVLICTCGIKKIEIDDLIHKAEIETQM